MSQADAGRIDVDLDGLCLPGLGIELHIREARAGDDQRVALLHRVLRRCGAKQADAAGRVRDRRPATTAFPSSGLMIGPATVCASCEDFLASAQAAAPGKDRDFLAAC